MRHFFQGLELRKSSFSKGWKRGWIALAWLLALSSLSRAQTYTIRDLGTLGGANSRAYDVNAAGWAVGEAETTNGLLHAFLWTPERGMADLGTLGGEVSRAYGINDRGQVVGEAETGDGHMLAFQWTAGEGMRALPLPEGVRESYAYGNNNYGVVAGAGDVGEGTRALVWSVDGPAVPELLAHSGSSIAHDVNDFGDLAGQAESGEPGAWVSRAFMLGSSGLHHSLGPATGEWSSAALTINARGLSAGFAELDGATHAVLLDPTNGWTDVDTLDSVYSVAYGLNATGQVVGLFVASHEDEDRAFVYQGGRMVDLNERVESEEPWLLVEARAISDDGLIVGYGLRNERERAYLLTPRAEAREDQGRVLVSKPERGARFTEGESAELEVAVTGVPDVHRVTFFANGSVLGSVTSAPYRLLWKDLDAGSYDLVASAADREGRVRRSPRVRMEVRLGPGEKPAVIVVEPDDGTALALGSNVLLHAEARAGEGEPASVTLLVDGQPLVTSNGPVASLYWTAPTAGLYKVTAVASNESGAVGTSRPVRINVSEAE
jgi:probable HAF family extracellular repeat protein